MIAGSSATRGYMLVTELLLLLITARWLTLEDRGYYAAALSLIKGMTLVSFFSLGQVALHRFASFKGFPEKTEIADVVGNLLIAVLFLPAIAFIIFLVLSFVFPTIQQKYFLPFAFIAVLALPFFVAEQYLNPILLSLDRLHACNAWTVIGKTVAWVIAIFFVKFTSLAGEGVICALIVGQVVMVLGGITVLHEELLRRKVIPKFNLSKFVHMLGQGAKLHPSAIGGIVFGSVDVLLILNYGGQKDVAIYQLALQMVTAMTVLPYAVGQVGFVQVANVGPVLAWRQYRPVLLVSGILMLFVAIVFGATSGSWIPLILGGDYHSVVPIFQIMLLGFPGMILSIGMAPHWIGRGHFAVASILTAVTAILSVAANLYAINRYGINGAAWVFVFAGVLSIIGNGVFMYVISSEKS